MPLGLYPGYQKEGELRILCRRVARPLFVVLYRFLLHIMVVNCLGRIHIHDGWGAFIDDSRW